MAPGQGLTSDHVGRLQGSQSREGVEGTVLLPEANAAVSPAVRPGVLAWGTPACQVQWESIPPRCSQTRKSGNRLPFALLVSAFFSSPSAWPDSIPPNIAPFCPRPSCLDCYSRLLAILSSLPATCHSAQDHQGGFPEVQLQSILPASGPISLLLEHSALVTQHD